MRAKRVNCDLSIWGLGIYINTVAYRYVAVQFGPLWIYLYAQRGLLA